MSDYRPGQYYKSPADSDEWDPLRLAREIQRMIAAASAANFGFKETPIVLEDLEGAEDPEKEPYLYRIAGAFALAVALLEEVARNTGESAIEVLKRHGLHVSQTVTLIEANRPPQDDEDPPEDPEPPLESV